MLSTIVAPELNPLLTGADHIDVKSTEANVTLREFVSSALGWQPGWRAKFVWARLPADIRLLIGIVVPVCGAVLGLWALLTGLRWLI
jgi:hypothetical protein